MPTNKGHLKLVLVRDQAQQHESLLTSSNNSNDKFFDPLKTIDSTKYIMCFFSVTSNFQK